MSSSRGQHRVKLSSPLRKSIILPGGQDDPANNSSKIITLVNLRDHSGNVCAIETSHLPHRPDLQSPDCLNCSKCDLGLDLEEIEG